MNLHFLGGDARRLPLNGRHQINTLPFQEGMDWIRDLLTRTCKLLLRSYQNRSEVTTGSGSTRRGEVSARAPDALAVNHIKRPASVRVMCNETPHFSILFPLVFLFAGVWSETRNLLQEGAPSGFTPQLDFRHEVLCE
jgi:hypothetical protein